MRIPDNFSWETWTPRERAVLLWLVDRPGDRILLIHKKRGLGTGKVNAPGGRLEPGEDFAEAAVRETLEEVGLKVSGLVEHATLRFAFTDGYGLYAKSFEASAWEGSPTETDEAAPFWCPLNAIPYDQMWADDPLWLPKALAGTYVDARFIFEGDTMLTQEIREEGPVIGRASAERENRPV